MQPSTFLFFGRSGAGKGTQAKLLIEYLKKNDDKEVIYIETGKGLREFVKQQADTNHTAQLVKNVMEQGGLLPGFVPLWTWTSRMIEKYTGQEHLILDGIARKIQQTSVVHGALELYGALPNTFVVFINTSNEWSKQRLLERGRADDTEEKIESRLAWFEEDAVPAMEYFKELGDTTFVNVDGEGTIEEVHERVLKGIGLH